MNFVGGKEIYMYKEIFFNVLYCKIYFNNINCKSCLFCIFEEMVYCIYYCNDFDMYKLYV